VLHPAGIALSEFGGRQSQIFIRGPV
jgi:hypothetical protein